MDPLHPEPALDAAAPLVIKILIAGGFGVGKTTFVGAVSDIQPLRTEARLSDRSVGVDDTSGVDRKSTTTVAMDFGRIALRNGLVLYLFGTPGQERFRFMWDELASGALGGVVVVDTRRLDECFPAIDHFERQRLPFIVAVNGFDGAIKHDTEKIRVALDIARDIPIVQCDVRERTSGKHVLTTLVEHVLSLTTRPRPPTGIPVP